MTKQEKLSKRLIAACLRRSLAQQKQYRLSERLIAECLRRSLARQIAA